MIELIFHADDFGLSKSVNDGIVLAHNNGVLTSTSIIANGLCFKDAVKKAKETPTLDIGVHLTLIEEKPLLNSREVPSLIGASGNLHPNAVNFVIKYIYGKINLKEVEQELEQQIRRVLRNGLKISHIDSHQHIHMLPRIYQITSNLAKKYHISAIRISREKLRFWMLTSGKSFVRIMQLIVLNLVSQKNVAWNLLRAEHFGGFIFSGNLNKKNLLTMLRHLPTKGTFEIMCHPGLDDIESDYYHWRYNWHEELKALTDPEILQYIYENKIDLISYRHLTEK